MNGFRMNDLPMNDLPMNGLHMNNLRLRWKIFIFLLGFGAMLLMILWLFQTVLLNETYKFIRTQELKSVMSLVGREIDNPDLSDMIQRIQAENEIIIMPTRDFVHPQRAGAEPQGMRGAAPRGTITEVKEFTMQNGQVLSLTFYAPIAPVTATVTTLRYQLYFVSGVMLFLAVILAIIIAQRISKPIEELNLSAEKLAGGNYQTHFNGKGFYEIVKLSDTLNTAAIELGRAESLRRELLANVSHDLRTPLALIYSYAEMMSDFPGEITAEQTRTIMDETRRLTAIVNDVLDISKLESEMAQFNSACYNLTQHILATTERTMELLKKDNFEINFEIDFEYQETVYVHGDKAKIDRAFYNLLINAINYSADSRHIRVSQTVTDNRVRISVTDYGQGIAESDLPFIWDRYYKSSIPHKRAVTGTGLGLSITKKIIERHNGRYGVHSILSEGSTFWFELPVDHLASPPAV